MNDLNGLFCWLVGWLIGGQWLQQPLTALTAFYYIREYECLVNQLVEWFPLNMANIIMKFL